MKHFFLFILISIIFFGCTKATSEKNKIDTNSEIANIILYSTRIVDSSYFLVKEQPMTYQLEIYDSIYEISHFGLTFIDITSLDNWQISKDELVKSFNYDKKGIYGYWDNDIKGISKVSYTDIPTFNVDSISGLNWKEINRNLGYGFIVISKPVNINDKYAFIGMNLYTSSDFIAILYLLEQTENKWEIIDYNASYLEFGRAVIDPITIGFPIYPTSMAIVGEISNILTENYHPITTRIFNAGRFGLLMRWKSQPNAKSFDLVSEQILFKTKP